ncbi:hypothetical protein [Bacillus dakarensis]|uniref:hypothetical protein n=1 Tax=Robertmurraya dakarensis TaxID=1926278 RepID=UPI000980B12E|nr:hypothetical protein [Bacillus dakarensis]
MKNRHIILACLLLFLAFNPFSIYAKDNKNGTDECQQMLDEARQEYIKLVMNDVLSSFDLIKGNNSDQYTYFTAYDIWKNQVLMGENEMYSSLKKLMAGTYRGEKRLYFFDRNPESGYILYKNVDNQNVMVKINRTENEWVIAEEKVKPGKSISLETINCDEDHFMQKMFDNLYP